MAYAILYARAGRPMSLPTLGQRANVVGREWATWVTGNGLETTIGFYNNAGDNIRAYNWTRSIIDDFEVDDHHNRVGFLRSSGITKQPLAPRVCSLFDDRDLPLATTRISVDNVEQPMQCMTFDSRATWLTSITEPGKPLHSLVTREYDDGGNLAKEINGAGEATTFGYDGSGRLLERQSPEANTTFEDHDPFTGWPRKVTVDPGGEAQVTSYHFDAFGHTNGIDRHGFGPDETWNWLDRVRLDHHDVKTAEGTTTEQYGYYENGQVFSVENDISRRTLSYDAFGFLSQVDESSQGSRRTTCWRRRPRWLDRRDH